MLRKLLCILFCGCCTGPLSGQKIWSLNDCMAYAVEHNREVRRGTIRQEDYRESYKSALADHFPSISGSAGASANFGRSIDPATNTYVVNTTFNNGYGIYASLPVFNGFSLWNSTRAARVAMLRGIAEQQQTEDKIALATMLAYVEAIYNREQIRLLKEKLEESLTNLRFTRRQSELGLKSEADVAQIEAEVAAGEYSLINGRNNLSNSILRLKSWMNYPVGDTLTIDTATVNTTFPEVSGTVEDAVVYARVNLPQAKIGNYRLRGAELQQSIAKGALYPGLSLGGSVSSNYFNNLSKGQGNFPSFGTQFRNNLGESVNLSVNIPIFGGLSRRTNLNRARNDLRRERENHAETMRQIEEEVTQAILDMENARTAWLQARKRVEATELAHRANRRKYEEGLLGIIELQTSANQLLLAKTELVNSRLTYLVKCRQVNYYKGVPLID